MTGDTLDLVSVLKWQETRFRKGLTYGYGYLCKMEEEEMRTLRPEDSSGIFYSNRYTNLRSNGYKTEIRG